MPEQQKPFHQLFQEHLGAGTNAGQSRDGTPPPKWKIDNFAAAVGCVEKSVRNWRNGSRTPLRPEFDRICAALFGANPMHAAARATLLAAWTRADGQRGQPGRQPATGVAQSRDDPAAAWPPAPEALATLYVHQNQGLPTGDIAALQVTVTTSDVFIPIDASADTPAMTINVCIRQVRIVSRHDDRVEPVPRTALGSSARPHPGVQFGTSWRASVPLQADGRHGGVVLDGETLREYRVPPGVPYTIGVDLLCHRDDLVPAYDRRPPRTSEKQLKVLNLVVRRLSGDARTGFVPLAHKDLSGRAD